MEKTSLTRKLPWKIPTEQPNFEVFLTILKRNNIQNGQFHIRLLQLLKERMTQDRSVVIKKADKGSTVAVWDRNVYNLEAEEQFNDANVHKKCFL